MSSFTPTQITGLFMRKTNISILKIKCVELLSTEDEDEASVIYEDTVKTSASVKIH